MAKPLNIEEFNIRTGAIAAPDRIYLVAGHKELELRQEAHSFLFVWKAVDGWASIARKWNSGSVAAATDPAKEVVMLGEDREATAIGSGGAVTDEIVCERGTVSSVGTVGGRAYVVGMSGLVLRREGTEWNQLDLGIRREVSFEAIAGHSEDDFTMVGWDGAIVLVNSGTARMVAAPTNIILTSVCTGASPGAYFCCGQRGLLLQGEGDSWTVIPHNITHDLWDVRWFQGRLYVSTIHFVYVYDEKKEDLVRVDMGEAQSTSAYHLDLFGDSLLLSVGKRDVSLFDGSRWTRIL